MIGPGTVVAPLCLFLEVSLFGQQEGELLIMLLHLQLLMASSLQVNSVPNDVLHNLLLIMQSKSHFSPRRCAAENERKSQHFK